MVADLIFKKIPQIHVTSSVPSFPNRMVSGVVPSSPTERLVQLLQPAVLSYQPSKKSGHGTLLCLEGPAVNSDERRGKKKKVSK